VFASSSDHCTSSPAFSPMAAASGNGTNT
jgi:hypothetical protein